MTGHPLDTCYCGDYRRDHEARGCRMCRDLPKPWSSYCPSFILHLSHKEEAKIDPTNAT